MITFSKVFKPLNCFGHFLLTFIVVVLLPAHLHGQDSDGDGITDDFDAQPNTPSAIVLKLKETNTVLTMSGNYKDTYPNL